MASSDSDSDSEWNKELIIAVSKKSKQERTISEEARRKQMQDCLDEGADINTVDKNGNTTLHIAVKRGYQSIVEFVLQNGASVKIPNRKDQTAMMLAEDHGKCEIADILRKHINLALFQSTGASDPTSVADNQEPSTSRDRYTAIDRLPTTEDEYNHSETRRKSKLNNALEDEWQRTNSRGGLHPSEHDNEDSKVPAVEEVETYSPAATLTRSWPGIAYQLKHLAFTLHCAMQQKDPQFFLATEMIEAEKLDDVVLLYKNDSGKQVGRFVQIKYTSNHTQRISAAQLLEADGEFSVLRYFGSWRKLKENKLFRNIEVRNMILCTNKDLNLEDLKKNKIHDQTAEEPDKSFELKSGMKKTACYKFLADKESNKKLYDKLKETSDIHKLAKLVAKCIYEGKGMRLETDIFRYYHLVLEENVFDSKKKKIHQQFIDNEGLPLIVEKFREIFISEYDGMANLLEAHPSGLLIWDDVQKRFGKLAFRKDFGKKPKVPDPQLTNLEELSHEFVELLKNARDYVVKIETRTSNKKTEGADECISFVEENLDKLTGHVLIKDKNKIKFSSQFLGDREQSSGNIEQFKITLKKQVGGEYDLKRFEFKIENYEFCTEIELLAKDNFSDDIIEDEEISTFFEEFTLAVNQPNEDELDVLNRKKIDAQSRFDLLSNKLFDDAFQTKIFDWFARKNKKDNEKEYFSYKVGKKFVDEMNNTIGSLIIIGVNSEYCEQIKAYDVHYKSDMRQVKAFLTENRSNSTSERILQLVTPDETLLTTLRVYDTLERIPKYRMMNSFIFTRVDSLKLSWIFDTVKTTFASESYPDLLIVNCESSNAKHHLQKLCEPLFEILAKNVHKRIIIITNKVEDLGTDFELSHQTHHVKNDDHSFGDLANDSQKKLLEKPVKFQGQKIQTSFGELLGISNFDHLSADELKDLSEVIDSQTLIELICNDEISVGCALEGLNEIEDYYINRKIFQRVVIKKDILKDQQIPDLFAISGMHGEFPGELMRSRETSLMTRNPITDLFAVSSMDTDFRGELVQIEETSLMAQNPPKYTILNGTKEDEEFKDLCRKYGHCNIHWLKKVLGKYIWKESQGDITHLVKYREVRERDDFNDITDAIDLNDDQLAAHDEPVIISDTAGMGKSVMLTRLACKMKQNNPDMLVLKIDLNHHSNELEEVGKESSNYLRSINGVAQFLVEKLFSNETNLTRKVFQRIVKKQLKIALIFDGFDEISPAYESTVIDFLETLKNSGIKKFFVATRVHTRKVLEEKLNSFSYEIQPLSTDNQEDFLTKFWITKVRWSGEYEQQTKDRLKKYAKAIMKKLASSIKDQTNKFAGVPLQTKLVAEIFESHSGGNSGNFESCEEFMDLEVDQPRFSERINLTFLYERFVEKKFDDYFEKKCSNLASESIKELRKLCYRDFINTHKNLALYSLFDKDKVEKLLHSRQDGSYRLLEQTKRDIIVERTGIITQFIDGKPYFGHRTYAEYFSAKFFSDMLKDGDQNESLQEIVVADVLLAKNYETMRVFMNCFLSNDHIVDAETWKLHLNKHRSEFNETVFHVAAAEANHHITRLFLNCLNSSPKDREVLINVRDIVGGTAVHRAAGCEHLDGIKLLLKYANYQINSQDKMGMTPLHIAAANGGLDIVKYLLDKGTDVNCQANGGVAPLHLAVQQDKLDVVKYLLNMGANVNCQEENSVTPLHIAARVGKVNVVKFLLGKGADIDSQWKSGQTSLHIAAQQGQLDLVKYLLDKGANINSQTHMGITPLYEAAREGKLDVVKYLFEKGANVNCRADNAPPLLHTAAHHGRLDVVKYLLDKGANINSQTDKGITPLYEAASKGELGVVKYLFEKGANVNSRADNGPTPLHTAAHYGRLDVVKYLLYKGVNINSQTDKGITPLYEAASKGELDVVKYLFEKGANVNSRADNGPTPLRVAVQEGKLDVVKYLFEKRANVNSKEDNGPTPLHIAALGGKLDIVKYLLDKGANINCRTDNGITPLYAAAAKGELDMVKYLLDMEANVNCVESNDTTPLHIAAIEGKSDVVRYLLDKGANVNCQTISGATPLHLVVQLDKMNIMQYLLETGANINSRDNCGMTPLHRAVGIGKLDVVNYLLDKGANLNSLDNNGSTPLYLALREGKWGIVRHLFSKRGVIKLKKNNG